MATAAAAAAAHPQLAALLPSLRECQPCNYDTFTAWNGGGLSAVPLTSLRGSMESCYPGSLGFEPRPRPLRKCASTPTLHSMAAAAAAAGGAMSAAASGSVNGMSEGQGMEVYVILRPFKEFGGGFFKRLPRRMRAAVRDAGLCHYLAVFKQRDGSLMQFDFGPRGGDIHVARGPFAFLSKSADGKMQRLVPGEVRERRLSRLPDAHMYIGRTPLSLDDIRAWNALQEQGCMEYELHRNDCRHYINCLVRYTTGRDHVASAMLAHQWQRAQQRGRYGLATRIVRVGQFFTDLANWGKVQIISNVSLYGMMALSGQRALARLRPAALVPGAKARLQARLQPMLQPVGQALAAPLQQALASAPLRHAMVRKPVVVGTTAAVATLAASSTQPALLDAERVTVGTRVVGTLRHAAQATLAAAGAAVARASAVAGGRPMAVATASGTQPVHLLPAGPGGAAGSRRGGVAAFSGPALQKTAPASPVRASLPSLQGFERSQRLALAITSAARR